MQNPGGQTKSIMAFSKVAYWRVGAIKQMRRLAQGNHGNPAMGQPQHQLHCLHSGKT